MLKRILSCTVVCLFVFCGTAVLSLAQDTGPADITIVNSKSKKPKPAQFPHKKHQDAFSCAECHHTLADGKQVAYSEGMEIKKCETCHNKDVLGGKKLGKLKLDTLKGAGHGNCLACHKEKAKADSKLKKLKKCSTCHPKKK